MTNTIDKEAMQKFGGSTAYIRAQVEVEQYFDQFKKYEGSVALKELADLVWQAAYESCLSEFEQAYVTKQGSKLTVNGDVTKFLADDTPLYTRKPVDKT